MAARLGMTSSPATLKVEVPHWSAIRRLHETPLDPLMIRPRPDQAPLIFPSFPIQEQATRLIRTASTAPLPLLSGANEDAWFVKCQKDTFVSSSLYSLGLLGSRQVETEAGQA